MQARCIRDCVGGTAVRTLYQMGYVYEINPEDPHAVWFEDENGKRLKDPPPLVEAPVPKHKVVQFMDKMEEEAQQELGVTRKRGRPPKSQT